MNWWHVLAMPVGVVAATAGLVMSQMPAASQAPPSSALITTGDLPPGWEEEEGVETFGRGPTLCGTEVLMIPGSEDAAARFGAGLFGPFVLNTVELSTAEKARQQIEQVRALPVPCTWEETEDGVTIAFRFAPLPFAALGEDSAAFRYEAEAMSTRVLADFVFIRRGRAFAILAAGAATLGPDAPELDAAETLRLAQLLDERLKAVAG